jgi:hypothetical protein
MAKLKDRKFTTQYGAAPAGWARRFGVMVLFAGIASVNACGGVRLRSPIAPSVGPPPTFVLTTSDVKSTRLIEVREGITKAAAFRAATDLLTQDYSIDVSDQRAGYLMTPWQATLLREGAPDLRYRTRVIIRFLGDDWKQVSVRSEAKWQREATVDEWEIGSDSKILDQVTNDLSARIGKKPERPTNGGAPRNGLGR